MVVVATDKAVEKVTVINPKLGWPFPLPKDGRRP